MVREKEGFLEVYVSLNFMDSPSNRLCFSGCSPPLALGSTVHSFPSFGSRAFSVSHETWLGTVLC